MEKTCFEKGSGKRLPPLKNLRDIKGDVLKEFFNGKPQEELIVPEIFEIKNALIKMSDSIFDVDSHFFPVEKIIYKGFCNLEKGDIMKVYLEKYNVEKRKRDYGPQPNLGGPGIVDEFYFERDFKGEEVVHKIEKLDRNNLENVLVTFGC